MAQKIKNGDYVIVTAGKNKGSKGKVLSLSSDKIIVDGVNLVKKHVKPNPQQDIKGGIVEKEAFIHISNVAHYNPVLKKADRIGFKILDGKKVRYFKSDGELVDVSEA